MNDIQLLQGDCLELLKGIPDGSIDLTVTSPPYDNLRTYNGNISQWSFEKFKDIAKELYRVTAKGGVVVWVVADATIKGDETGASFKQALWFKECGFKLHDTMIYQKDSISYPDTKRYYSNFEYMFVFSKGVPATIHLICDRKNKHYDGKKTITGRSRQPDGTLIANRKGNLMKPYGVRFNVWKYSTGKNKTTTDDIGDFPAPFPEKLAHDHIVTWSNPGDTVLDPFMGSGTTGKMSLLNERNFVGMEIDEKYFNIAKKRIAAVKGTNK